ncbi:hypothetical protein [Rhizobium sp. Leaf262]|uniref:hypothetical protein n=1 Tax=Rhizobium sp. Leaf262 TaxID=1736312 RepID=UPI0007136993|nr:hypothetical protein [Rhizobium sp. Leaf262]KQO81189.1 hypothetical protein ASF29_17220 [Rhizobium sp. Leaf262]
MIDLHLEQEYVIDNAAIAASAGVSESQVVDFYCLNHMAMADGRLAIRCSTLFEPERVIDRGDETFQIDLSASGAVLVRDLARHFPIRDGDSAEMNTHVAVAIGDSTLYLTGNDRALLVPASQTDEPYAIEIAQPLGRVKVHEDKTGALYPGYAVHPVAEGNVIAMPLQAASSTRWLAFLSVDIENRTASWSAFPVAPAPSGGVSLLRRLFGTSSDPLKAPTGDDLLQLVAEDFPHHHFFHSNRPRINQALLRAGRVYIYTKGHGDSPKWGYPCSGIAEIGPDGRVKSLPFMQDYTRTGDERKYGIEGRFTASGRFCILSSVYKTTDPWKGRQKLFDMDSGALVDVNLPRGFSKYRLIDQAGDHFWAELWPIPRGDARRIARFRYDRAEDTPSRIS